MLSADSDASLALLRIALRGCDGTMGREVVPDFVTKRKLQSGRRRRPRTENVDDDDVDAMIPG